jgi:hypothetical protein
MPHLVVRGETANTQHGTKYFGLPRGAILWHVNQDSGLHVITTVAIGRRTTSEHLHSNTIEWV